MKAFGKRPAAHPLYHIHEEQMVLERTWVTGRIEEVAPPRRHSAIKGIEVVRAPVE